MSRPLFILGLWVAALAPAAAQDPVRPWLDWRTIATPNYRFHYLPELETWTRDVAARIESADSLVSRLVGYSAPKPVNVVVDDPYIIPNGYALPMLDKPVTVFYATPADPRNDIGNYRTWGELLSVHEITHLAHLARPSRNPLQRALWSSLPANLGPITLKAPRWVYEGYATVIEGRVTGTGRPMNAWRPAILRQWAIEGQLPGYAQLGGWSDFGAGEFAYLGGSAFLEWLIRREGDAGLPNVWRRLTARRVRSFEAAFTGVFGDAPPLLYGRHVAELTRDAMAARATLAAAGLVEGELIQRLTWATGDPAVSPNGERVAVVLRERERPGRVVVWKSTPQPEDTAAIRKRIEALTRDPEDVPDRRFYPVPKVAEKTLLAANGRSYQMPRWYADNRRVLLTRWTQRHDGSLSPALYAWDTESGDVRQVTPAAGVLHGDPHPNGAEAVAMQCHRGRCDIVRVDLESGVMRTLMEGAPDRTYYRPRYSPDGRSFAASVLDDGRWKVIVVSSDGEAPPPRVVDPNDGANRYDADWLGDDTLVVVSERGGIPNLEMIGVATPRPRTLTRVTGAAVGPGVNRRDGSIWFLSLHARGFDVRRLARDSATADSAVAITHDAFGYAGAAGARANALASRAIAPARAYGAVGGPRHQRWLPGGYASADGMGAFVSIYSGDIIGRLNAAITGAYGAPGTWQGGSLRAVWRAVRPQVELGADGVIHEPSLGRHGQPAADSLDGSLVQALLAVSRARVGEHWRGRVRIGGAAGPFSPRDAERHDRALGFGEVALQFQQVRGALGLVERLRIHADYGETRDAYRRVVGSLEVLTVGRDALPLQFEVTAGRLSGNPHPFERFTIGGVTAPVMDTSLLSQRHGLPWFPTAIASGTSLLAWRAAIPGPWTLFLESASATNDIYSPTWHRALGLERRIVFPHMPVAFIPRVEIAGGVAYTLDEPFRRKLQAYFEMRVDP